MKPPLSSPHTSSRPPRRVSERVLSVLRAGVALWPVKLVLGGVAAWGAWGLWIWVTTESVSEKRAGDTSSPIQIEGLRSLEVHKDGKKYWEIAADSVKVVDNGDAWVARNVTRGVLFRDDKPWVSMKASRVRLSNLSKNLDAVGGVSATGPDGFSFATPQARWLDAKKLVEIPGHVEARLRDMEFSAPNLTYQWERGELQSPGKVELRVPGGVLRGARLGANLNTTRVDLSGGVELVFVPGVVKPPRPFTSPTPATPNASANFRPTHFNATGAPNIMFRPRSLSVPLAVSLATAPAILLAQAQAKPPVKIAPAKTLPVPSIKTAGNVVIDSGSASYDDNSGVYELTSGVKISQTGEEFLLNAQRVVYSQPKNQASATGDLKVETRSSTIRGTNLFGDFNTKILSFAGNVVISAHDKGNGMNGFRSDTARKPVRIACTRLDWNYSTRQATIVGNIRIVQADNSGTCDKIIYDETKNAVQLLGNVRFGNSKKQQFIGNDIVIFVDKGLVQTPQNVTIRSGMDAGPSKTPRPPAPAVKFPGPAPTPGSDFSFSPPVPIESLVPTSTPRPRPKPTLEPIEPIATPKPTPKPTATATVKATPSADESEKPAS